MELKRPKQNFVFQIGRITHPAKHHLRFFPIFSDESGQDIAHEFDSLDLKSLLEKHSAVGTFKASAGELLPLVAQGLILGGLGKRENFHPETACALFRALGTKLAKLEDLSLDVTFTAPFSEALNEHYLKKETFYKSLDLNLTAAKKKDAEKEKIAKPPIASPDENETEEPPFDFVAETDLADMVTQLIACMNLGAEPMKLLKTEKSKNKKVAIKVGIIIPHLDFKDLQKAVKQGTVISQMLHGARFLAAAPGNYMHPGEYEKYARSVSREYGLKLKVFNKSALERLGCGGILAVGRGSPIPPRMLILEYQPRKKKIECPLILVGKGITFDTGGISLKPPAEMHEMKYDMCGSALALHGIAFAAACELSLPVVALLGLAENMPDGAAIKPGDVYTAYDGSTVEVQNTDAEGRLVLADLLAYAVRNYTPLCILDFATLTGACVVALGHIAAGVMTASEDLSKRIKQASLRSLDRSWRLPHWSIYGKGLKSEIADQRNITSGRDAGTISAMRFLAHFVPEDIPWAHFDIAGTAWRNKAEGSQCKGPTGWGIRLLSSFMKNLAE